MCVCVRGRQGVGVSLRLGTGPHSAVLGFGTHTWVELQLPESEALLTGTCECGLTGKETESWQM